MKTNKNRRSELTPADIAAAKRLRAHWDARDPALGLTQEKMGGLLGGKSQGAASHYINGRNALNYHATIAFAAALGIDAAEIRDDLPEFKLTKPSKGQGEPLVAGPPPKPTAIPAGETGADYVRVIDTGAEAGMGDGQINDDFPEVIRAVDYTRDYIRGIVGFIPPPGRLVLVTGRGDSMIPTIQPGESLLVDTGVQSFDGDGIYLVNLGNGQQVKRLRDHGLESGVHVHSDNPVYTAIPMPRGAIIGGKIYLRNRIDRLN